MALDTRFVPLGDIQEQFWDKLTDAPMAGGTLSFYSSLAPNVPKEVYALTGVGPAWTYTPIGSVITLSSIGTTDYLGNNVVPYLWPYDSDPALSSVGNVELYYIVVTNADGQFQFQVEGVPNIPAGGDTPASVTPLTNLITNGQFVLHYDRDTGAISDVLTNIAYGGWYYNRSTNSATEAITFDRIPAPIDSPTNLPSGNPRYRLNAECTIVGADTYKIIEVRFEDVNRFSDNTLHPPSLTDIGQPLTMFFTAKNNSVGAVPITIQMVKNFGAGGSAEVIIPDPPIAESITTDEKNFSYTFYYGSNEGKTLGAGDDDYFALQILLPTDAVFDVSMTDFVMYLGDDPITAYPLSLDPMQYVPPYYQAFSADEVVLNTGITTPQLVTGTTITLPAGTYLLCYQCSLFLDVNGAAVTDINYVASSIVLNTATAAPIPHTDLICNTIYIPPAGNIGNSGIGSTQIVTTLTETTSIAVYGTTNHIEDLVDFIAKASITAIRLGWS